MENIRSGINRRRRNMAQKVRCADQEGRLADGTPIESAYERMSSAGLRRRSIRAEGSKNAQIIRANADADAARTYAAAFGKDPQFYDFYRAMQSYQSTFIGDGKSDAGTTNVILSPNNSYLKEFTGR